MELYQLEYSRHLFGFRVETFPQGIKEAFEALMEQVGDDGHRAHYGLSYMDEQKNIFYFVAIEELYEGEGKKYHHKSFTIEKGTYLTVTVHSWMEKINTIKDIFHELMQDTRADLTTSCIEWYKTDDEMICMLKMKTDQF